MLYAVIDTNVLVSALLNFNSKPGSVLLSVFTGTTIPLLNAEISSEYHEVLSRRKFKFPAILVSTVLDKLEASALEITVSDEIYSEVLDPKDQCFYAVTMTGRLTNDVLLVTGNVRHFPQQSFVVTPAQFVEIAEKSE